MSTDRNSLRIITITVFMAFFLKICIGSIYQIFDRRSPVGEWYINYVDVIKMLICLLVVICLVKGGKRGAVQDSKKNRRKWLYVIPVLFFVTAMLHRVYFLREGLEKYLSYSQRSIYFGYEEDYNNLLWESAVLLLMFFIINPLVYGERTEKKGVSKSALVAATFFIMLAIWNFYRIVFIGLYYSINGLRFWIGDYSVQLVPLLCGFGLLAFLLLRGKRKFLIIGAGFVLLYDVIYCSVYPQYIVDSILDDFSYLFGYLSIIIFSIVTLVLEKRGRELKSRWWFAFPVAFLTLDLISKSRTLFLGDYPFIDDYQSIVHCFAIFFAMIRIIVCKRMKDSIFLETYKRMG